MRLRKALQIVLISALASGTASGQGMPVVLEPSPPPVSRSADLDFTDDFPVHSRMPVKRRPPRKGAVKPAPAPAPEPAEERKDVSWIYWTLGTVGLTAAAGGAVWYIHSVSEDGPAPLRNDQVFTDAP